MDSFRSLSLSRQSSIDSFHSFSSTDSLSYAYPSTATTHQAQAVRLSMARPVLRDLNQSSSQEFKQRAHLRSSSTASSASSSSSFGSGIHRTESTRIRSCWNMTTDEARNLWRCMLTLQQRYGCYDSKRMDMAVGVNDVEVDHLMPSRAALDTLNGSIQYMPEEGWKMLNSHLHRKSDGGRGKFRSRFSMRR